MTPFEMIFWPTWLFCLWLFQDKRMIRLQCWAAEVQFELAQKVSEQA